MHRNQNPNSERPDRRSTSLGLPRLREVWAEVYPSLEELLRELRRPITREPKERTMSATEEPHTGIAVRETSGAAIVKAVPIPAVLQELGVKIAEDEGGLRVIVLPPNVRNAVNLLTPVSSWGQADPNWTPAISLVQLDKEAHTYPLPGSKLGLNKQALEALGKTAGVLYTRTARVPRDELQDGEMWAYRATVGFRRSDGTIDEVTRERGFNREAEQMEIEDGVRRSERWASATPEAIEGEIRKRWIAELRFGPSKTESKAINRALRSGLGIPTSVTAGMLSKPFLVVGFNFTPDYSDPEIKRALVAVGLNAQAAIYGGRERSEDLPEHGEADIPALPAATPRDGAEDDAGAGLEPDTAGRETSPGSVPGGVAEQTVEPEVPQTPPPAGGSSDEPSLEEDADPLASMIPPAAIDAAGAVVAKGEKRIREVVEAAVAGDAKATTWLRWAVDTLEPSDDDERRGAIELYAMTRHPELWATLRDEAVEAEA